MTNRPLETSPRRERESAGCESCGLWKICFPARAAAAGRHARRIRIRKLRFPTGKTLYRHGDEVESIYMIRSGCIKEIDESAGRRASVVNFALPGEMLSLQNIGKARASTTSIALVPSHVCCVSWASFGRLCAESPRVVQELIRLIAKTAATARDLLTLIRDREAIERVAGFLLNLSARLQVRGVREREFRLVMNRDDIAAYLGLRSETVSRSFSELGRRGLIAVRAKRVQLLQPAELRRVCAGE
jgi:CRP/FNR family transcriptional regulator